MTTTIKHASTKTDSTYCRHIMEKLESKLEYKTFESGHRFTRSTKNQTKCYMIRSGVISIHRQPDDVLIEYIEAPTMRGNIPIHVDNISAYTIRVIVKAEIAIIDLNYFYALLNEHHLWEAFARHLQLIASIMPEVIFKLTAPTVFEAVRMQLYELMEKPQSIRDSVLVEPYIREKIRASRSAIMRILSDLKNGGYIVIENGYLKDIKNIPLKY